MSVGEEPDVGKLQVRFCEGHSRSLTLVDSNLLAKGRDLDMSTRHRSMDMEIHEKILRVLENEDEMTKKLVLKAIQYTDRTAAESIAVKLFQDLNMIMRGE